MKYKIKIVQRLLLSLALLSAVTLYLYGQGSETTAFLLAIVQPIFIALIIVLVNIFENQRVNHNYTIAKAYQDGVLTGYKNCIKEKQ